MAPMAAPDEASALSCFGNSIVGIAFEGSDSVCSQFDTIVSEVIDFIDETSGVDTENGANGNRYVATSFSSFVDFSTEELLPNNDRAVSDLIEATFSCGGGTVNVAAGIRELTAAFNDLGEGRGVAFVVLSDFPDPGNPISEALVSLRASGVVVVAIAVGSDTSMPVMMEIADEDGAGAELIFSAPSFDALGETLVRAFSTIDVDNDGFSECDDGCPTDSLKIEPEFCGCGVVDAFPGGCLSFDDIPVSA